MDPPWRGCGGNREVIARKPVLLPDPASAPRPEGRESRGEEQDGGGFGNWASDRQIVHANFEHWAGTHNDASDAARIFPPADTGRRPKGREVSAPSGNRSAEIDSDVCPQLPGSADACRPPLPSWSARRAGGTPHA